MGSVAYNPPDGKDYKWYISGICQLGDGLCHRSHLLGEPFQQPLIFCGSGNSGTSRLQILRLPYDSLLFGGRCFPFQARALERRFRGTWSPGDLTKNPGGDMSGKLMCKKKS